MRPCRRRLLRLPEAILPLVLLSVLLATALLRAVRRAAKPGVGQDVS